ncbi:transporter [Roseovarius spongiae]|uniref:Transporter n=1 Tax=Roseovarius spongiae TaxID=2320272 RepID=A0A3A8AVA5_9RHOB|nr:TolC family outer membrane protein [Roseovarius spongiae]RKF14113.1 transporter [Roseovarius spongiae]
MKQANRPATWLRRAIPALGLAASLAFAAPAAPRAESLADALVSAYKHSGLLVQNRALLRAADEDVAATVAGLRPIINWSSDITRSFSKVPNTPLPGTRSSGDTNASAGITAELLLYDFGRTPLQISAAKEAVLATRQTLIGIEQQVLLRAVQAYMNVQRNSRFVSLRQSNVRVISQSLRAARDRFEVGEVTRTDVAQAEARLASARGALAQAQGDLTQAIEEYIAAIGHRPGRLTQPPRLPRIARSVDSAKAVAVRSHPDVLKVQHDVAAAELNIRVAEAAMKPRVTLNGSLGVTEEFGGSSFRRQGSFGVQATGPIYQGGRLSAAKRRAQALRDAQRGVLHVTTHAVRQNVGNAYAVLRAARATADAGAEGVRAAQVAFDGVREEAKLGSRTTLDVLNAEQELLNARFDQISAQADVYIAAYRVLAAMGQLTVRDLNLAVQTYDPAAYYNLVKTAPVPSSKQGRQLDRVLKSLGKR